MSNSVTYDEMCNFFASKCNVCRGAKRVLTEKVWTCCPCQFTATAKWRLEQFDVYPSSLKYKEWNDFTGINYDNECRLTSSSLISSKQQALKYCFGTSDPSVLQNKNKHLHVLDHLKDGQNVIIAGPSGCGKTLLAILIIKEVIHASRMLRRDNVDFKYIKSQFVIDAARWDNDKPIDRELLDQLADIDFLVIDNMDLLLEGGHHTTPPDMIALSTLFTNRQINTKPTILICSERFWGCVKSAGQSRVVKKQWGEAFWGLVSNPTNTVIEIAKESYAS